MDLRADSPRNRPANGVRSCGSRRGRRVGMVVLAVLPWFAHPVARAENWPSWRGPLGTGISSDARLPLVWDDERNVRWRAPLPDRGNSTPGVWGGRVFVTQAVQKENRRAVMCFDRADGRLLWQAGVTYTEREPTNGQNPYCAASPATDGKRVVAYYGSPGLYCYDTDGRELWRRDLGKVDSWQGSGSSPVIHGGLCFLNAGPGTNAALVACDVQTGEVVWRVKPPQPEGGGAGPRPAGEPPPEPPRPPVGKFDDAMMAADPSGTGGYLGSWSTPVLVRTGDRDALVVVHPLQVTAYEPATGKQVWTCTGLPEQAFASPAVGEGVLVALGRPLEGGGTRVTALKLDPSAAGDITNTHRLWQTHFLKECVGSPVVAGGHAYLVTTFGSVVCLDLATGRKVKEKRLSGTGNLGGSWSSLVLAGEKLLVPNQSGEVFVLAASPELEMLATNVAREEITCASPALARGQLFLRTYEALWCLEEEGGRER